MEAATIKVLTADQMETGINVKLIFDEYCIREFSIEDVNSLAKYANNYFVSKNLRDGFPHPYTLEDAASWINFVHNHKNIFSYAIANADELIGGIGAMLNYDVNRFTVEIGYWLGEPFWNKGIATRAVKTFCHYLFTQHKFNHITASVFEGNSASMQVLKNAGFVLEGVLRKNVFKENKYLDQYVFGLLKEELK